jgi:hypothetical protein
MKIIAMDYNCTVSSCVSSQVTLGASRKQVYGARNTKVVSDCGPASSIQVDFAPTACTQLAVNPATMVSGFALVPNPATASVTMKFNLQQASRLEWKMTDMAGRIILSGESNYGAGAHETLINLQQLARGIYFVNLTNGQGFGERLKLVLQ